MDGEPLSAPETMPNTTPHPEGPELRMSRVNPPHRTALHCQLRTMDLTKLGNQPCSHSIVVGISRHFSMSPTLSFEHLPLCIRSSLVSSCRRAEQSEPHDQSKMEGHSFIPSLDERRRGTSGWDWTTKNKGVVMGHSKSGASRVATLQSRRLVFSPFIHSFDGERHGTR